MSSLSYAKNITTSLWGLSDESLNYDYRYPYIYQGPFAATPKLRSVTSYVYNLPFGRGKAYASSLSPALNTLVSGWTVSGITTFQSGSPDVVYGPDTTGTGDFLGVNRICNPNNVSGGRSYLEWYNTSCFASAPYGTLPNFGLGAITDPGINNWDISISKSTRTHFPKESGRIDVKIDFLNAWNHVQWGDADPYIGDATFGRISSTRPARQMQFAVKYSF